MFHQAHNFSVSNSKFSVVQGNQTIIYKHCRDEEDGYAHRSKKQRQYSICDDYKKIRRGDIELKKLVHPWGRSNAYQSRSDFEEEPNRATTRIEVVRVSKKSKSKTFMAITYEGMDSHERWGSDFMKFARVREPNSWQLYAFTRSSPPSLIFHHELLPLQQIYDRASPLVQYYLRWRLGMDWPLLESVQRQLQDTNLLEPSQETGVPPLERSIWIDPSRGTLCYGPTSSLILNDSLSNAQYKHGGRENWRTDPLEPFSSEPAILDFFQHVIHEDIHNLTIMNDNWGTYSIDITTNQKWFLGCLISLKNQAVIGSLPINASSYDKPLGWEYIDRGGRTKAACGEEGCLHESIPRRPNIVRLNNKWTRVNFENPRQVLQSYGQLNFSYAIFLRKEFINSWLSQAHYIFNVMGISPQDFARFGFSTSIQFYVDISCYDDPGYFQCEKPIFLFLPPLVEIECSCGRIEFEFPESPFWSFDASGNSPIKGNTLALMQLPDLRSTNSNIRAIPQGIAYCIPFEPPLSTAIKDYQVLKGYDPYSNEYARERGWPLFEFDSGYKTSVQQELSESFPYPKHQTTFTLMCPHCQQARLRDLYNHGKPHHPHRCVATKNHTTDCVDALWNVVALEELAVVNLYNGNEVDAHTVQISHEACITQGRKWERFHKEERRRTRTQSVPPWKKYTYP